MGVSPRYNYTVVIMLDLSPESYWRGQESQEVAENKYAQALLNCLRDWSVWMLYCLRDCMAIGWCIVCVIAWPLVAVLFA